jgi:hypothetical protein
MTEKDICTNLYKEGLITYDKYLDCINGSINVRAPDMSDMHKYAIQTSDFEKVNIYDKQINIYSSVNEGEHLYLSVINNKSDLDDKDTFILTLTSGIIDKENTIFIIEKTSNNKASIKNYKTNKYITFDILNSTIGLTDKRKNKTDFIIKTYIISGLTKYKFILLKNDGSESEFNLIINKDDKLSIERNSNFYWYIENLENVSISELDLILAEISELKTEYNKILYKYYYLTSKKSALEYIINSVEENIDNIFSILEELQSSSTIEISIAQLEVSKVDTNSILNDSQITLIRNKISEINDEIDITLADLEMYKNNFNEKIEKLNEHIYTKNEELTQIKEKIKLYNRTLINNNIIVDSSTFFNSDNENTKAILKSQINRDVANIFNGKKTRVNVYYIIIIIILLLIIILQLSSKLLFINSFLSATLKS